MEQINTGVGIAITVGRLPPVISTIISQRRIGIIIEEI